METTERIAVNIEAVVDAPLEKVWRLWNEPNHITKWCQASDEWHAPYAENDLKEGGSFKTTMAAKDGSVSFDFEGKYDKVIANKLIEYTLLDGRRVSIQFREQDGRVAISETFETENTHPAEMQRAGWQAILDSFKRYTESTSELENRRHHT